MQRFRVNVDENFEPGRRPALRLTPRALAWLLATTEARLLHRFETVCNLVNQSGEVLTLQLPAQPLGPFACEISERVWLGWRPGEALPTDWRAAYLTDGKPAVGLALWNSVPDWPALRRRPRPEPPYSIDAGLLALLDSVVAAVAREDAAGTAAVASALAGRGGGLTPAGDDMLLGLIFAIWCIGADVALADTIAAAAAGRTTTLSAAFLRAGAAGEASAHWQDIAAGRPGALERLWDIGHTSGQDAWLGFGRGMAVLNREGEGS